MITDASNFDTERFTKVHSLMTGGATPGERAAAKSRAEAMAARAGMSLGEALSTLDGKAGSNTRYNTVDLAEWQRVIESAKLLLTGRRLTEREAPFVWYIHDRAKMLKSRFDMTVAQRQRWESLLCARGIAYVGGAG